MWFILLCHREVPKWMSVPSTNFNLLLFHFIYFFSLSLYSLWPFIVSILFADFNFRFIAIITLKSSFFFCFVNILYFVFIIIIIIRRCNRWCFILFFLSVSLSLHLLFEELWNTLAVYILSSNFKSNSKKMWKKKKNTEIDYGCSTRFLIAIDSNVYAYPCHHHGNHWVARIDL